jgi:hypothetical protein
VFCSKNSEVKTQHWHCKWLLKDGKLNIPLRQSLQFILQKIFKEMTKLTLDFKVSVFIFSPTFTLDLSFKQWVSAQHESVHILNLMHLEVITNSFLSLFWKCWNNPKRYGVIRSLTFPCLNLSDYKVRTMCPIYFGLWNYKT